jgi:putative protease
MEIEVKNKFSVGDRIECIRPQGNLAVTVARMETAAGAPSAVAPGSGHRVWIDLPAEAAGAFIARFL